MNHLCNLNFRNLADGKNICFSRAYAAADLRPITINRPVVLISDNTATQADGTHFSWIPPNVIRWYTPNACVQNSRVRGIPVGIASPIANQPNNPWYKTVAWNGDFEHVRRHMGKQKKKWLFASFAIETNPGERTAAIQAANAYIGDKTVVCFDRTPAGGTIPPMLFERFISSMAEHRFVLSPPGTRIDCMRTWEALYLGCIPICKRSLAMSFFSDLPILFIDHWNEVTPKNLERAEENLRSKWANTGMLWIEWWQQEIQRDLQQVVIG